MARNAQGREVEQRRGGLGEGKVDQSEVLTSPARETDSEYLLSLVQ
jgi:hypothetical protein